MDRDTLIPFPTTGDTGILGDPGLLGEPGLLGDLGLLGEPGLFFGNPGDPGTAFRNMRLSVVTGLEEHMLSPSLLSCSICNNSKGEKDLQYMRRP